MPEEIYVTGGYRVNAIPNFSLFVSNGANANNNDLTIGTFLDIGKEVILQGRK